MPDADQSLAKRALLPRANASNTVDVVAYLRRYEEQITFLINWSETGMLEPKYVHLHEYDLGFPKHYKVAKYIESFIGSTRALRSSVAEAYFCYSYERTTNLDQASCERNAFFAYELESNGELKLMGSGGLSQPPRTPIGELTGIFSRCNVFQPYMLTRLTGNKVRCDNATVRSPAEVAQLLERWQGYQFSLYAFAWREPGPSDLDLLLLRQAFLTHILTWNHY